MTLVSCVLLSGVACAVSGSALSISVLKYEPVPAEIGKYVDVWIKVENTGSGKSEDLSIKMVPEYPLSLDSEANALENIGILGPESAAVHKYRLFVDENAKQGVASFDVQFQKEKNGAWVEETFEITIGSAAFNSKGNVQIEGAPTKEPEVFMPGDTGTITFTLKNSATAYSVTINGEDFDTNARVQSATLKGTDGLTVVTDTYYGSGILGPGESMVLTYNIIVDDNVSDGTYYLDFSTIGSSHSYNNNWRVPIKVDSSSLRIVPSKPLKLENGIGTLEFDVANIHPNSLSSVSVRLEADGVNFSPSEYFVGSMDPDELFTIQIYGETSSLDDTSPRELKITANYRNGFNEHEEVIGVKELQLETVKESGTIGPLASLLLVAVLAGAGYLIYKRRKQK
ncbi:COG1361 S-layer family protein [Methanomethylovorans sp.]|uniref:COG1361 S-layer family protein n=1 Tax=Methanomethylovorans sp. TaxID=2758717 RepID=UPI003D0BA087